MEYTLEQLKAEVAQEAENIKKYATPEEIDRLNFDTLNPTIMDECIYGQMTGDCFAERACNLIQKCAVRYIADQSITFILNDGFERIKKYVNGTHVEDLYKNRGGRISEEIFHYSAIEAYILLPEAKNKNLIAHIKGQTKTLNL